MKWAEAGLNRRDYSMRHHTWREII